MLIHPDDADFTYSTDMEWDRQAAYELGADDRESAWILTDRDVWHKNPFYQGPPVRHPEDDSDEEYRPAPATFRSIEINFNADDNIPF